MAQILAYPLARRRGLIRKQGARLADMPKREAEKHLAYLLRLQGDTLARKGIEAAEVGHQVAALETAVRCEIARRLVTCGGRSLSRATRKGAIVGAFVAHPLELRRSPAWRALSDEGRRVLARLELEHMEHGGAANGALACTYADFVDDGMRRTSIPAAIRQCVALGFLEVTQAGRPSIADFRRPSLYRLTYLNGRDRSPEPTHEWRAIGTDEAASAAVAKAVHAPRSRTSKGHPLGDIDSRPKYGLTL